MNLFVRKNERSWVDTINKWLVDSSQQFQAQRIFLPAGETPRPLYESWEYLAQLKVDAVRPLDNFNSTLCATLKKLQFIQLDEIVSGTKKNAFKSFFEETLPSYQNQFEYINQAERGADLAVLGLGVNGHVAFHEPGIDRHFYSGCLTLNLDTCARLKVEPRTKVVSYGLEAFLNAKAILLIVRGDSKRDILSLVVAHAVDLSHASGFKIPAAHLLTHKNLTILADFDCDAYELNELT